MNLDDIEDKFDAEQWKAFCDELLNIGLSDIDGHLPYLRTGNIENDKNIIILREYRSPISRQEALSRVIS